MSIRNYFNDHEDDNLNYKNKLYTKQERGNQFIYSTSTSTPNFEGIKNIITNNSLETVDFAGKTFERSTKSGQVIYRIYQGGVNQTTFANTTWFLIHGTYLGQIQSGQNFSSGNNNTLWSSPGGYNGNRANFHPTIRVFPDVPGCEGGTLSPPATRYPPKINSCNNNGKFLSSPFVHNFYGQVTFYDDGTYYVWCADKLEKFFVFGDNSGTYTEVSNGIEIQIPKSTTYNEVPSSLQSMTILGDPQELELHCTTIKSLTEPNMSLEFMVAVKLIDPQDILQKPNGGSTALRWNGGISLPNDGTDVITV